MSFRWQRGRFSASLYRRGARAGSRLGSATLAGLCAAAMALAACGATVSTVFSEVGADAPDCSLPWSTMDQVFDCASSEYELASVEGEQTASIIVAPQEPVLIAAALAHAWNEHVPADQEAVVYAWSDPAQIGLGYDRGVVSEQGELGELLVFQICTSWTDYGDEIGEICGDRMEVTIEQ